MIRGLSVLSVFNVLMFSSVFKIKLLSKSRKISILSVQLCLLITLSVVALYFLR